MYSESDIFLEGIEPLPRGEHASQRNLPPPFLYATGSKRVSFC